MKKLFPIHLALIIVFSLWTLVSHSMAQVNCSTLFEFENQNTFPLERSQFPQKNEIELATSRDNNSVRNESLYSKESFHWNQELSKAYADNNTLGVTYILLQLGSLNPEFYDLSKNDQKFIAHTLRFLELYDLSSEMNDSTPSSIKATSLMQFLGFSSLLVPKTVFGITKYSRFKRSIKDVRAFIGDIVYTMLPVGLSFFRYRELEDYFVYSS